MLATPPDGAASLYVSETLRWIRWSGEGAAGDYWIGYTGLGVRQGPWDARAGLAWTRWSPSVNDGPGARSGLSALYLSLGRKVWDAYGGTWASPDDWELWVRGRLKAPLRSEESPIDSGEPNGGVGITGVRRFGRWSVYADAGYLELGSPPGLDYQPLLTGSLSASRRLRGRSLRFVASLVGSTPAREGDSPYAEVSAGFAMPIIHHLSISLTGSAGLTDGAPRAGAAFGLGTRI